MDPSYCACRNTAYADYKPTRDKNLKLRPPGSKRSVLPYRLAARTWDLVADFLDCFVWVVGIHGHTLGILFGTLSGVTLGLILILAFVAVAVAFAAPSVLDVL